MNKPPETVAYQCPFCNWMGFQRFSYCAKVGRIVDCEGEK